MAQVEFLPQMKKFVELRVWTGKILTLIFVQKTRNDTMGKVKDYQPTPQDGKMRTTERSELEEFVEDGNNEQITLAQEAITEFEQLVVSKDLTPEQALKELGYEEIDTGDDIVFDTNAK